MHDDVRTVLDERIRPLHRLEHPFYKAWTGGTLTKDNLATYAEQYWHHVDSFPTYLTALLERLPNGVAKTAVADNLRDEVEGGHDDLWLDFAAAVGADKHRVLNSIPTIETDAATGAFVEACKNESPAFALGALYAYESQTVPTAVTKTEGLRDKYGIEAKGREYFDLHATIDEKHSDDLLAAIADVAKDERGREEAAAGAEAGARAAWKLLDGIAAQCGIDC